jgi:hypothetical protein
MASHVRPACHPITGPTRDRLPPTTKARSVDPRPTPRRAALLAAHGPIPGLRRHVSSRFQRFSRDSGKGFAEQDSRSPHFARMGAR